MLFCTGDWLKCLLLFSDSCTFCCFIECLHFESLSALLGGHKSGHSLAKWIPSNDNKHFSSDHVGTHPCVIAPRKDFHCGHFDWTRFIPIWSFQFKRVMGFMLNIKSVNSKFTIVGIMWDIFWFSCDIIAINLRYIFSTWWSLMFGDTSGCANIIANVILIVSEINVELF